MNEARPNAAWGWSMPRPGTDAGVPDGRVVGGRVVDGRVLGRRVLAWLIDALLVAVLVGVAHVLLIMLGLLTFGIGWALLALLPTVPLAYAFVFLAGPHAATPGQRLMGLRMVEWTTLRRPTGLEALVNIAVFAFSLAFPPLLLLALVTSRHRTLHDIVSGLLMVRIEPAGQRGWTVPHGSAA